MASYCVPERAGVGSFCLPRQFFLFPFTYGTAFVAPFTSIFLYGLKYGLFYSIFMKSCTCYLRIYCRLLFCIYLPTYYIFYVPWTELSSAYRTTNDNISGQTGPRTLRYFHMLCVKADTRRSRPPLAARRLAAIVCGAEGDVADT